MTPTRTEKSADSANMVGHIDFQKTMKFQQMNNENNDYKIAYEKLQSSTNATVNGLLEELRNTEDALSGERKRNSREVEKYQLKVNELTNDLEKAKSHIEDNTNRAKVQSNDKEMRLLTLQNELERIKSIAEKRDVRIDELEKQKQIDRSKLLDLKDNYDASERMVMEIKTRLELEQMQRRKLEAKLKSAYDQSSDTTNMAYSPSTKIKVSNSLGDDNHKIAEKCCYHCKL